MSSAKHVVILGSGPAGYVAAIRAAQLGMKVTVVEKDRLGGVCLNRGCIPTKALLAASALYEGVERGKRMGVKLEAGAPDWAAMQMHQQRVVGRLVKGIEALFAARKVEVVRGEASFVDAHTLRVKPTEGEAVEVSGDAVLVATGSESARPKWLGFGEDGTPPFAGVMTSDEALRMGKIPSSVLVVGGGYIGCEFASLWTDLKVKVTVVEMLPMLMTSFDEDVSKVLWKSLKRRGTKILLETKIEKLTPCDAGVRAELSSGDAVEAEAALVAVGRRSNGNVAGLAEIGVRVDKGVVPVDTHCRTNVEGVYAAGDVTGQILLAHYASHQGIVAVETMAGLDRETNLGEVPGCAFTNPDAASVGLTEAQARETLGEVKVGRYEFAHLGKAVASGETDGFAKIIADGKTDRVVGLHVVGAHAENLIQEGTLALRMGATLTDLAELIYPHPTMSEAMQEAALVGLGRAIHKI